MALARVRTGNKRRKRHEKRKWKKPRSEGLMDSNVKKKPRPDAKFVEMIKMFEDNVITDHRGVEAKLNFNHKLPDCKAPWLNPKSPYFMNCG